MIKAEEMCSSTYDEQVRFVHWLAETLDPKCWRYLDIDIVNNSINFMSDFSDELIIPREFLTTNIIRYDWSDHKTKQLNKVASKVISNLGWHNSGYNISDFIIYFNDTTYTNRERRKIKRNYPDVDINPILNFRDNLFKKFGVPEINLPNFDKWFTELATKHKDNLTQEERNNHGIILTNEEYNRNYIYKGEFLNPYDKLLTKNGWHINHSYYQEHGYILVKWD